MPKALPSLRARSGSYLSDSSKTRMVCSIDAGGMRSRPENGWFSSRIKKIALATANEPNASAAMLVGLRPESTLNPQNNSIAHDTTMVISGQEIELANCRDMSNRVCWKDAELIKIEKPAGIANPKDFRNEIVKFVLRARAHNRGKNPAWTSYEKIRKRPHTEHRYGGESADIVAALIF
jgi:PrkA serine protein kinase C-terminal domain